MKVTLISQARQTVSGNNRSHAMNKTKRAVKPNLPKSFYSC